MTDIVERLQEYSVYGEDAKVRIMAALAKNEIERLRASASALPQADSQPQTVSKTVHQGTPKV